MKSFRIFSWLLLLLLSPACISLVYSQPSFRVGFQGGLAVSDLKYSRDVWLTAHQATRRGFVVAAIGEIVLNERWSLQIEPRYVQKGRQVGDFAVTSSEGPEVLRTVGVYEKLDYLEIPLYVTAKFPLNDIAPFLFVGPSVGFLLAAKLDPDPYSGPESSARDMKGYFKATDVAVDAGLGVEYHLSPPVAILFEGTYSHGLLDIWATNLPSDLTVKNYTFHLSLGLMFEI